MRHEKIDFGWKCPVTNKPVTRVWSKKEKTGWPYNTCPECCEPGDNKTLGQRLHELNERRKNEKD